MFDDGVRVKRRSVFRVSLGIAASGACTAFALSGEEGKPIHGAGFEPVSFEAFTSLWKALVKEFVDGGGVDADYAARLASLLARRERGFTLPDYRVRNESEQFVAGPCWFDVGMAIVRFEMKPSAILTAHDHPPQIVVTAGIDGAARFRHFESIGVKPAHSSRDPFLVRETRSGILEAGRVTSLTRDHDWIHTFEAGKRGATIADFTATLSEKQDDWSYVSIGGDPAGPEGAREATWTGKQR